MKKKILSIIMFATITINLVACGSTNEVSNQQPVLEITTQPEVVIDTVSVPQILKTAEVKIEGEIGNATCVNVANINVTNCDVLMDYLADKVLGSVAYDITLSDNGGQIVQPAGAVEVTIDTRSISGDGSDYVVYYVNSDAFEKMPLISSSNTEVSFETTHFSVYLISKYDGSILGDASFVNTQTDIAQEEAVALAEPIVEATQQPIAEPTVAPTEAPTPEPVVEAPKYTFTDVTKTLYAKSNVNVRDLPSTDGKKVSSLSMNDEVAAKVQCDQTGWYGFELNGNTVYVSNDYLVSEKVVAAQTTKPASSGGMSQMATWGENGEIVYYPWDKSDGWTIDKIRNDCSEPIDEIIIDDATHHHVYTIHDLTYTTASTAKRYYDYTNSLPGMWEVKRTTVKSYGPNDDYDLVRFDWYKY